MTVFADSKRPRKLKRFPAHVDRATRDLAERLTAVGAQYADTYVAAKGIRDEIIAHHGMHEAAERLALHGPLCAHCLQKAERT